MISKKAISLLPYFTSGYALRGAIRRFRQVHVMVCLNSLVVCCASTSLFFTPFFLILPAPGARRSFKRTYNIFRYPAAVEVSGLGFSLFTIYLTGIHEGGIKGNIVF